MTKAGYEIIRQDLHRNVEGISTGEGRETNGAKKWKYRGKSRIQRVEISGNTRWKGLINSLSLNSIGKLNRDRCHINRYISRFKLNPFRLSFSEPKCARGCHIIFLESIFQRSRHEIVIYSINRKSYNKKVNIL